MSDTSLEDVSACCRTLVIRLFAVLRNPACLFFDLCLLFWKMENCNNAFKLINFQFLLHIYHLEMWKLHVELFISSSINLLNTIKVSKFKLEFFYHGLNQCGKLRYCGHRHHFPRFYLGLEWPRKCYQLAVEC